MFRTLFFHVVITGLLVTGCATTGVSPSPTSNLSTTATVSPASTLTTTARMTHGPLVGAVTAHTADVWLRTNEPAPVALEYTSDGAANAVKLRAQGMPSPASDFTLHIPLDHLQANTVYTVTVLINDQPQAQTARFKTFPEESQAAPFKLVILTDFGYTDTPPRSKQAVHLQTFRNAANENGDLVFIGGDFDHRDPKLLPDKRKMFQDLYADDPKSPVFDFSKYILHQFALAHQWDDHDFGGDNSDRTAAWRETALQVYKEYFPSYPLGKYGIYQSFHYGKDVEIFDLDGRSQRDPNLMEDGPNKSMLNGEQHPDGQLQWLLDGLKNSTATWKLVMTSSPLNKTLEKADSWARFTYERDKILEFIRDNHIRGVLFIGGDLHGGALDDGRNAGIPSVVVPSANLFLCFTLPGFKLGMWSNGVYGDPTKAGQTIPCPGYAVVTIKGDDARVEIKDADGKPRLEMNLKP